MNHVEQACPLRTQGAAIDRMVGIPFDVNDACFIVFGIVAEGVHDHPATHRTIRAGAARLSGARKFEIAHLRQHWLWRKSEHRDARAAKSRRTRTEELPPIHIHALLLRYSEIDLNQSCRV